MDLCQSAQQLNSGESCNTKLEPHLLEVKGNAHQPVNVSEKTDNFTKMMIVKLIKIC